MALSTPARGEPILFQRGALTLTFDENTGALLRFTAGLREIARSQASVPSITFGIGPAPDKLTWLEEMTPAPKLLKQARPAPDTLELTLAAGQFEWVETHRLLDGPPRLDRSLRLINRGAETVKLRRVAFRLSGIMAKGEGFYRLPMVWPPRNHDFTAMQPGRKQYGRGSIAPGLAQLAADCTLLWASYTQDTPGCQITEASGTFDLRQTVQAAGYLRPDEPQEIGFVSLEVLPGDYWAALARLWDWMDSVGLKVPEDQPAWIREAILYSFHPGGTIASDFTDLGGFAAATEKLLPTLPRLGVNAIWILPVEYQKPYWPLDYYRFMDGLGTGDEYKRLVARAHELKLKVLQDLVPHGGAPSALHNQQHPEFMLRREDGSTLKYWLNDFAWPAWQQYLADVAGHYVRQYDIDGYRVDAAYGSKEFNWNEKIPYARASLADLNGGLGMLHALRAAVRQFKPAGAILAEVESARHAAESDAIYDYGFCYTVCQNWRKMEAAEFVTALQDYLEEQRLSEPRGTVRLRHIESHDSLRAQGWYGVRGMETFYALSAWIDGIPMIYHGMEIGHSAELARINEIRRRRPELSRGLANYRAVECDVPGVFTCLRQLGQAASVVVINFNRQPITANLTWPQGRATVTLGPLGYTLLPEADIPARNDAEWFVDTVEGRLCDRFDVSPQIISGPHRSGIYWRPQCGGAWWSNEMLPLAGQLGTKGADGRWEITRFSGPVTDDVRLLAPGRISGASGSPVEIAELPPAPDPTAPVAMGGVTSRCVGSEYIISNRHYSVTLRRQGGMIRQLRTAHGVVAENQDLYGERAYFPAWGGMRASEDVESGIRLWREGEALHLSFTGQIRGVDRFALKRPALFYRNEFAFTDSARFTERWAFRTEQDFHDQDALLAFCIGRVGGEKFTFGKLSGEIEDGELRIGQTNGPDLPAEIRFSDVLVLQDLHMPSETDCHLFMRGRSLFFTLLDGAAASLSSNRWYEFSADWNTAP